MRRVCLGPALAVALLVFPLSPPRAEASGSVLAPPPRDRIYRAAFPDFGGAEQNVSGARIRRFERLARARIAWAYFSNNWFGGRIRFPGHDFAAIHRAGRLPFVRLMARSSFRRGPDPNFSLASIANGEWDSARARWCDRAAALGYPILAEFGTEVNGDWFPWNGRWNGGGRTGGFGDPSRPDGPERFVAAYRHIVELCRARGADDITWFWHVDVGPWPPARWNRRFANYFPGPRYVDWIGVSDYGPLKPGQPWTSFGRRLDRVYRRLARLPGHLPIAVLEYGAAEDRSHPGRKAGWIRHAIASVARDRWPRIRALSYWHEAWQNHDGSWSNLHIDSSRAALSAYRRGISRPPFTSRPRFVPRRRLQSPPGLARRSPGAISGQRGAAPGAWWRRAQSR